MDDPNGPRGPLTRDPADGDYPPPPGHQPPGYPQQPGQQPPFDRRQARAWAKAERARAKALRPWYAKKRWWLAGAVVMIIVFAVAVGGGEDKDDDGGRAEPAAASDGEVEVFTLGQTAHTGDFDVTVHAATDPFTPSNPAELAPQAGNRYVAVDVTMANTSDGPLTVSTLVMTELVDASDRAWPVAIAGLDLPKLDAMNVGPGQARRGWVVFEVGADATDLRVRVKGNLTATGSLFQL